MLYDDSDLHDALLPVSAAQLTHYLNVARKHPGAVLELACGSGQLIVPVASLSLVEGDMREFDLGRRFSLIFVARNSLLHLSEPHEFAAFFSSVRRHLEPHGILAFDVFNPDLELLARPSGERFPVMRRASPSHGEIAVEAAHDYDRRSQVNRATWYVSTAEKRDAWVIPLHLRSIFPQELLALLAANGFQLIRRDGDFAGGEFTSTSTSQVCQCRLS